MTLDDAYISAPLDKPYNADDVLKSKAVQDADTLLSLDFDKDNTDLKLEKNAKLTGPDGGRFGRGLHMEKSSLATMPFKLPSVMEEGTIEFWLSADPTPLTPENHGDKGSCICKLTDFLLTASSASLPTMNTCCQNGGWTMALMAQP